MAKSKSKVKKRKKSKAVEIQKEYPPFGEKKFWDRHERAHQSRLRKDAIGEAVKEFMAALIEKYAEEGFDPRKDISWYMEQLGNGLRGDLEREKADARRTAMALSNGKDPSPG